MAYLGVIFDIDGTLIDSNDSHAHAWIVALEEGGYNIPFKDVRRCIGMGGDKLLPELTGVDADEDEGKTLCKRQVEVFQERYQKHVNAFKSAAELLVRLRQEGLKLAIATSAQDEVLKPLLDLVGGIDQFEQKASSQDVKESKPDPDIVQAALAKLGLKPEEVVMIGDTPYDVAAAVKAGVACLALRCGGWADQELKGARWVYENPAELVADFDRSPFAPKPVGKS